MQPQPSPTSLYQLGKYLCVALFSLLTACQVNAETGKGAATIIGHGVVNSPGNKSLRFDMLKFGLDEFCSELLKRGAPLRLEDGQPIVGRYFGETCQAKSIDTVEKSTIIVQFGGRGFAWTAGTGRLGFRAKGLLELAPDFRVHDDAMYVYFRPVLVDTSDFELLMTERKLAQSVAELAGVNEQKLGRAIIDAQLGRGFTAVRYDSDGHTDFALGLVDDGQAPFRPFTVVSSPRRTIANGRTELFSNQQDFLGRITLDQGEEISLTFRVEGTSAVDFALLSAERSTAHISRYLHEPGEIRPKATPSFLSTATAAAPTKARVKLPAGDYFLVLDHSSAWGSTSPAKDELPARVDYLKIYI